MRRKASCGVQLLLMAWLSRERCSGGQIFRAMAKGSGSVSIGAVATLEVLVAARLLELDGAGWAEGEVVEECCCCC